LAFLGNGATGIFFSYFRLSVLEDVESGKLVFVRETLCQCIQLSYYDRVKSVLPPDYLKHNHVFPNKEPGFDFKYSDASSAKSTFYVL